MPTRYTVTVTLVGSSSTIVLPKPVVDGFNLKKGDKLEMTVTDMEYIFPWKNIKDRKQFLDGML